MNSGIERKQAPLDRHNYYDSFFRSMVHGDRVRSGISDILREVEQLAVDLVKLGQASGEFRDDHDALDLARYLVQVFYGQQWIAWIHGAGVEPRELEANSQLTFDLLLSPYSRSAKAGRAAQGPISPLKPSKAAHTERMRRSS